MPDFRQTYFLEKRICDYPYRKLRHFLNTGICSETLSQFVFDNLEIQLGGAFSLYYLCLGVEAHL